MNWLYYIVFITLYLLESVFSDNETLEVLPQYYKRDQGVNEMDVIKSNTYQKKWFIIGYSEENWFRAWQKCVGRGMQFASVNNIIEQEALIMVIKKAGANLASRLWLSGNNLGDNTQWVWRVMQPMFYTNWDEGEPNNKGRSEHCVSLVLNKNKISRWNDVDCFVKLRYVCQYFT